jgi:DNA-binding response OmpR family regulator/HPt (histidine-containing phosphotransfer) domain-containing protein
MRVLVVEDDPSIAQLIEAILQQENYAVDLAHDGQMGLALSESYEYDLILLDVSLPKRDGISICQEVRSNGVKVPILLLTALDSPADRARGLNAGADDYLGKPFDPEELLARTRALLRRSSNVSTPILAWGNLQLDPLSATVTYANWPVAVTPKEYAMLELLLRNSKRVFSCNAILEHLWSYDEAPSEEAIRTHIKGIRQKLRRAGATTDLIETVYGIGYRLKPLNAHKSTTTTKLLINHDWDQFKNQSNEQIAVLKQFASRFLNKDIQLDWQMKGKQIAHSLAGSLGNLGFPLGSELAKQIEKLLGEQTSLNDGQGQRLYSLVSALQQELTQPISATNIPSLDADLAVMVLVVSTDAEFDQAMQSAARERGWKMQNTTSIAAARMQLHKHTIRSILIGASITASADQTEEILQLLVEVGKHVPAIPVVLNSNTSYPEIEHIGICINLPLTSITNIVTTLELAIAEVERNQTQILIVDDDPKILAVLQAMLIPWGLKVTTLSDPQQFLEVLNAVQPDLLVLDVEMPYINGLELCRTVRNLANWSELPVIFLTAHNELSLIQEVFAIGADDFVTKPVVEPEIILRILNLLERKKLQHIIASERSKVQVSPLALSSNNKIQLTLALAQIQDSLSLLKNGLMTISDHETDNLKLEERHQLFQNICTQVEQLHKLMLPHA